MESFVHESAIAPLIHEPSIAWQEKRYIGEDYAGLDEYADLCAQHVDSPILSEDISLPHDETDLYHPIHNEVETPLSASTIWKNAFAMGSAAAILIAAALGGLWAAHTTAPDSSTRSLPDGNAKTLTTHSHLSALPHTH